MQHTYSDMRSNDMRTIKNNWNHPGVEPQNKPQTQTPYQAVEAHAVVRRRGSHMF
jgi:hypothetical protein